MQRDPRAENGRGISCGNRELRRRILWDFYGFSMVFLWELYGNSMGFFGEYDMFEVY